MRTRLSIVLLASLLGISSSAAQEETWILIGYQTLITPSGEAAMHMDPSEGGFSHLRFEAQGRGVLIEQVRFDVQGGEPITVRLGQTVGSGHQSRAIDLPESRIVTRARIRYRLTGEHGRAILNLLGSR